MFFLQITPQNYGPNFINHIYLIKHVLRKNQKNSRWAQM